MTKQQPLTSLVTALAIGFFPSLAPAMTGESAQGDLLLFAEIPSVYSASKYEQKETEAPSRVSIITAEEIKAYGYRTFTDVINSLPGFYNSNDRNYDYTGVRGFSLAGDYNSRLLVLLDGHRINENIYDSVNFDTSFPVDLAMIERVEVVRGPSSSLYGSSAFFGVINIITKEGRYLNGLELSTEVGSFSSKKARISYGKKFSNGLEWLISASRYESDGDDRLFYPEFININQGIAENADASEKDAFFTKIGWGDWKITAGHSSRTKNIPTAPWGTEFNTDQTLTIDENTFLDIKHQYLFDNGFELSSRLYWDRYQYFGDYLYDYGDIEPDLVVNKDEALGQWWGLELQAHQQLNESNRLIYGFDYQKNTHEDQLNFDIYGVYLDDKRDSNQWSVYLQDEIKFNEHWMLNIGLRNDHYSEGHNELSPRLALILLPDETSSLKLLYGSAFRAPSPYELYYNDGFFTTKPAIELKPETIDSLELIYEKQFEGMLHLRGSLYQNKVENLIGYTLDPVDELLFFTNKGEVESTGLELELEKSLASGGNLTMSYTYQDSQNTSMGQAKSNSPDNMLKLNYRETFFDDALQLGLEMQYESARLLDVLQGDDTLVQIKNSDRVLTNLTLRNTTWIDGMSISLNVKNLFDEDYSDPASLEHIQNTILQNGRDYRIKFEYLFN